MPEEEKKPEEKKEEKKETEEICDPLTQDCDTISTEVRKLSRDRAIIYTGIRNLKSASEIFEDDRFKEIITDAEKLRDEFDQKIKQGFKSFNICGNKKTTETTEETTIVKAPETKENV